MATTQPRAEGRGKKWTAFLNSFLSQHNWAIENGAPRTQTVSLSPAITFVSNWRVLLSLLFVLIHKLSVRVDVCICVPSSGVVVLREAMHSRGFSLVFYLFPPCIWFSIKFHFTTWRRATEVEKIEASIFQQLVNVTQFPAWPYLLSLVEGNLWCNTSFSASFSS